MSKINKLSDKDLSRWIAEKLGWTWQSCGVRGEKPHWHEPVVNGYRCHVTGREPDMVNDPAMTVMLLEKRCFYDIRKHPRGWVFTDEKGVDHKHVNNLSVMSLGRAVAEAFALASGWEVK